MGRISVVAVGVGKGDGVAIGFFWVPVGAGTVIFRTGTGVLVGLSGACDCVGLTEGKAGIKVPGEELRMTLGVVEQFSIRYKAELPRRFAQQRHSYSP
jgi:hypothetical protein